jgi:hypothetical protein
MEFGHFPSQMSSSRGTWQLFIQLAKSVRRPSCWKCLATSLEDLRVCVRGRASGGIESVTTFPRLVEHMFAH